MSEKLKRYDPPMGNHSGMVEDECGLFCFVSDVDRIQSAQRDLMREAAKKLVHICVEDYMIGDDSKETLIDLIKRLEGEDNGTD